MNILSKSVLAVFLFVTIVSCYTAKKEQPTRDLICYSFDQRQCATDAFGPSLNKIKSVKDKEVFLVKYLNEKGLEISELKLVENYHGAVCEACDICPEAHRFFIKSESNPESFTDLKLLNFTRIVCREFP